MTILSRVTAAIAASMFLAVLANPANAMSRNTNACSYTNDGKVICLGSAGIEYATKYSPRNAYGKRERYAAYDAIGNGVVLHGRPAGAPRAYCGYEASVYVFGVAKRELFLAYNWVRKFARTSPAPGMAAARPGHVMILISHVSGNNWLVHDGNSGGGMTRRHVRSIASYTIVDPRQSRTATLKSTVHSRL